MKCCVAFSFSKSRACFSVNGGSRASSCLPPVAAIWYSTKGLESTDDAYTDGRAVDIAPRVTGVVVSLDVTDNQFVHKGDPLIHIDPRQFDAAREQAEGVLASAKAQYQGQVLGAEIALKNFPAQLEQARPWFNRRPAVNIQ